MPPSAAVTKRKNNIYNPSWCLWQDILAEMSTFHCRLYFAHSKGCVLPQIILPEGYLREVYEEMHAEGAVCVADEVQCGFGRAGDHFWAFEEQGIVPDIVTLGKPIGNGFPLGAVVSECTPLFLPVQHPKEY